MPGGAVELDLAEAGIHMFVEKPVSTRPIEEVAELSKRLDVHHSQNGVIVAVGYMLRHAAAVRALQEQYSNSVTSQRIPLVSIASMVARNTARNTTGHIGQHFWSYFRLAVAHMSAAATISKLGSFPRLANMPQAGFSGPEL